VSQVLGPVSAADTARPVNVARIERVAVVRRDGHWSNLLDPTDPAHCFTTKSNIFRTKRPDATQPKQAEQIQCNTIEQFYVSNIQVTKRYLLYINYITHRTDDIVKSATNTVVGQSPCSRKEVL